MNSIRPIHYLASGQPERALLGDINLITPNVVNSKGLQVQNHKGEWIDVHNRMMKSNNVGDMLSPHQQ
jgi:isopenicillin N synthase-like dioxygenase